MGWGGERKDGEEEEEMVHTLGIERLHEPRSSAQHCPPMAEGVKCQLSVVGSNATVTHAPKGQCRDWGRGKENVKCENVKCENVKGGVRGQNGRHILLTLSSPSISLRQFISPSLPFPSLISLISPFPLLSPDLSLPLSPLSPIQGKVLNFDPESHLRWKA